MKTFFYTIFALTLLSSMSAAVLAQGMGNGAGMGRGTGLGTGAGHGSGTMIHSQTPSTLLASVATGTLSEQEKQDLAYQYSEEMVARDAYNYFFSLYGVATFQNIAKSEQQHMDAVKALLERYNLPLPTTYGTLESIFTALKAEGEKGLKEALEVGIKIEMLDIEDIIDTIKSTDNDDIKVVLTNIGGASYNHIRGFAQGLASSGFSTTLDYSKYLSAADVNTRGPLKTKLALRLESEGVQLPSQASSVAIGQMIAKDQQNMQVMNGYRQTITQKYGNAMGRMSQKRLTAYANNIDRTLGNIQSSNTLAPTVKEQKVLWYTAWKEYLASFFQ